MKKKKSRKTNDEINENLNQENATNIFLPSTKKNDNINNENIKISGIKKKSKKKKISNLTENLPNEINNEPLKEKSLKNSSLDLESINVSDNNIKSKSQKSKKNIKNLKKDNILLDKLNNNDNEVIKKEEPKKIVKTITVNEVKNINVPTISKNKRKFTPIYVFCIYRRNAYPFGFNPNSKVKEIFTKLSKEIKIEKNLLEFRINDRIITNLDEEKLIKDFIDEERNDKIYVTKLLSNYMVNNLYNKTYNNIVIIENSNEIKEIEKKLNKFLEEYHMEKDYFFKKINDNKYSFGFSYPDFAFDFNRLLLILKRTEDDFKNIKSYLKLEKKKNRINFGFNQLLNKNIKNKNSINLPNTYISYDQIK